MFRLPWKRGPGQGSFGQSLCITGWLPVGWECELRAAQEERQSQQTSGRANKPHILFVIKFSFHMCMCLHSTTDTEIIQYCSGLLLRDCSCLGLVIFLINAWQDYDLYWPQSNFCRTPNCNKTMYLKHFLYFRAFSRLGLPDFHFDPIQYYRCETAPGPQSASNSRALVQWIAVVSVWIKLNHCSFCL